MRSRPWLSIVIIIPSAVLGTVVPGTATAGAAVLELEAAVDACGGSVWADAAAVDSSASSKSGTTARNRTVHRECEGKARGLSETVCMAEHPDAWHSTPPE
ncbi:hypothetical protein [Azospirillum largimobile]